MLKVGILGGGQLGRMLLQAAVNYSVETFVLENDNSCPAAHLCNHFVLGDFRDYDTVYQFGKGLDVITIEIESINTEALHQLKKEGIRVIPDPTAIDLIRNKIRQKEFYLANEIPSSPFVITQNRKEIEKHNNFLPAVHKIAEGGYDGKGVQLIKTEKDVLVGFDAPSVLEKQVDILKEIALIVAIDTKGKHVIYPATEMIFDPIYNLLDFQLSPARLEEKVIWKMETIAHKLVKALNSAGLFAVEFFLDKEENVWVNETAPRVHNSGHHTIEANYCSQFDMLWRIILEYPLGNADPILPSAMVNIIGEKGYEGEAAYEGLEDVLKTENAFVHLYGKLQTKPGRKMGHITIISEDYQDLTHVANRVKHHLKVKARQ